MLRSFAVVAFAVAALASPAAAQKNCRKGIPCGNSCISATKTCRIRTAPALAPEKATAEKATAHPVAGTAARTDAPWVASSRGTTYYRSGCSSAKRLSAKNLIYFETEDQAKEAGYKRSRSKGC